MSLMLNALKRIEAKQASARAVASATAASAELPKDLSDGSVQRRVDGYGQAPAESLREDLADAREPVIDTRCAVASEDENAESVAAVAVASGTSESIELPRELTAAGYPRSGSAEELTADEVALPGAVSLETAMDELSDLLTEARFLDRPPPASEPGDLASLREDLDRACGIGLCRDLEMAPTTVPPDCANSVANGEFTVALSEPSGADEVPEPATEANGESTIAINGPFHADEAAELEADKTRAENSSATNAATPPAIDRPDFCELPEHDVCVAGGLDYETSYPLGAVEVFAAAAPAPEMVRASLDSIHAALAQSPGESIAPEAAEVVAEPMTIDPLGSDPYAAAAWQVLQQIPKGSSQVLLFTSPGDAHGKTTTLARLLPHVARSFAGSVLVVDANTRNPDLARRLEVAATWRLTDVLAGATHWMNAVRPTALPRVSLLPGGTETSRRPNTNATAGLLRELAGHYDLVLVDATSLAHDGAAQLAAACDGTCLVVRLGEAGRRIVRDAVRVLSRSGGRLLGCIAIDAGA